MFFKVRVNTVLHKKYSIHKCFLPALYHFDLEKEHHHEAKNILTPIAPYLPWTFPWNVRKVPSERSRNVPRTKKMSGYFERSKAMFSECSCGTFQERSKGILRESSAAIFREYSKRTFLEPSIGTFKEHLYRTFVELFVGTFREHSQRTF